MRCQGAPPSNERRGVGAGNLCHLVGLIQVMHLSRGAVYALAVGLFGAIAATAAARPLDAWTLARLLVGVVCVQAAIAGVKDYSNRYLDAVAHPSSPIVRGLIQPWEALALPTSLTAVMLVLVGTLGPLPLLLACGTLVLGLLCILYFKGSLVSVVLYALYAPLTPLLAWSVFGRWQPFLPWLLPLGAVAGVGLYVAGSLPEVEREIAIGLRGLPHRLGPRRDTLVVCVLLPLLLLFIWTLSLAGIVPADGRWLAAATAVALLAAALAAALYLYRPGSGPLRAGFVVQLLGTIALCAGWLLAVAL